MFESRRGRVRLQVEPSSERIREPEAFSADSPAIGPRLRHLTQVVSQPVLPHQVFAANISCCDPDLFNRISADLINALRKFVPEDFCNVSKLYNL